MRALHRALLASAGLLGAGAALLGSTNMPASAPADREARIEPIELGAWIKDRKPGLRVIDLRSVQEFDVFHLPGAESAPLDASVGIEVGATLVFYDEEDVPRSRLMGWDLGSTKAYVLRGGVNAWVDAVMNPVLFPDASPVEKADFERASEISRYFGGQPRSLDVAEAVAFRARRPTAASTRGRGC